MDLHLTDDQEMIRSTAADLLAARGGAPELWKEMTELGWIGLALPEAYGGLGLGFLEACLLIEQMGRFRVASPFLPTVACCALPIARFGGEEQRARWLPAIARGRVLSCAAAGGPELTGERLDGTAMFVPYADTAEDLLVVAGSTVCLVDMSAPGITSEPLDVIGPARLFRVSFDGVGVPSDRVVGGSSLAEAIDLYGCAATCAEMVGGAQRVLDMTVSYATEREAFGRPIGSFQAVQHHCADMATDVLSSRYIAYEAIWRLSENLDAALEVSMAKAWVSEAYERVCALGHQVHGAIGFTAEHELHHYTRHAMTSALTFGDARHHWERIADRLGLPTSTVS